MQTVQSRLGAINWRGVVQFAFEPFYFSDLPRPNRRYLQLSIYGYTLIIRIVAVAILFLSVAPYHLWLAVTAICALAVLVVLSNILERSHLLPHLMKEDWQLARATALIIMVTFIISYLYFTTSYLEDVQGIDYLWLLYVLIVSRVSLYSFTNRFFIALGTALCGLMITLAFKFLYTQEVSWIIHTHPFLGSSADLNFIAAPWRNSGLILRTAGIQALWLILLSFLIHFFARLHQERAADVKLLAYLQNEIASNSPGQSEAQTLQNVVDDVATSLGCPDVHIFKVQSDGKLKCIAAHSEGGKELQRLENFRLDRCEGIVGHALKIKRVYWANDVDQDKYYVPHDHYPYTKAELAVPFAIGPFEMSEKDAYVLDVQVHRKHYFLEPDREFFETLARQIGYLAANVRFSESLKRLSGLATDLEDLIGQSNDGERLERTLQTIADAACAEFGADVTGLFACEPYSKRITHRIHAGTLHNPGMVYSSLSAADSLVPRLMKSATPQDYFHSDVSKLVDDPLFGYADYEPGHVPFVEREHIRSRAVLSFGTTDYRAGVMFLNFRERREFTDMDKGLYKLFEHLAALAILSVQVSRQIALAARQDIADELHDKIKNLLFFAYQSLQPLFQDKSLSSDAHWRLGIADYYLDLARSNARQLSRSWNLLSAETLKEVHDFESLAGRIIRDSNAIWGPKIAFTLKFTGPNFLLPAGATADLIAILYELINNCVEHSGATCMHLQFDRSPGMVHIEVEDNGRGISLYESWHGLKSVESRIRHLRGESFNMQSSPGEGTRIAFTVPTGHANEN